MPSYVVTTYGNAQRQVTVRYHTANTPFTVHVILRGDFDEYYELDSGTFRNQARAEAHARNLNGALNQRSK